VGTEHKLDHIKKVEAQLVFFSDEFACMVNCNLEINLRLRIVECLSALYIKLTSTPKRDREWEKPRNLLFRIARNLTDTNRVHPDRVIATSAYSVGLCGFRSWQGCIIQQN
jgi:hypothetical protein